MGTAPKKSERERAADRIAMDYQVPILQMPDEQSKVVTQVDETDEDKDMGQTNG